MDRVRIGVLGAGRGLGFAAATEYAPSAEGVAFCDANEERLAKAVAAYRSYRSYTSYEKMLDSDLDAVIVASPMPLHVAHSVQALRAGKHVLSEVTAATTIEQCWELLEAVKASGRKYMFAENYCYMRPWMIILGMVKAGVFGEVYYGESDQIQEFKRGLPHPDTGYNWRTGDPQWKREDAAELSIWMKGVEKAVAITAHVLPQQVAQKNYTAFVPLKPEKGWRQVVLKPEQFKEQQPPSVKAKEEPKKLESWKDVQCLTIGGPCAQNEPARFGRVEWITKGE